MPEEALSIQIKLDDFVVTQFHQEILPKDIGPDEIFNFNHAINIQLFIETHTIHSNLDVDIIRASTNEKLAFLTVEAVFILGEGFDKLAKIGGIPGDLMLLVINLTYSTTRGIIIERFRGTPLHRVYMPIINPNELLKNLQSANKPK